MKKIILLSFLMIAQFSFSQIEGKYKTIDDETKQEKSVVEIFKKNNGKYYAKILELLIQPKDPNCSLCTDDRKGKPILGVEVIRDLQKKNDTFEGGTITDPKSGKIYKCSIKKEGENLIVRGYIGFSLIGRNQTWIKVK